MADDNFPRMTSLIKYSKWRLDLLKWCIVVDELILDVIETTSDKQISRYETYLNARTFLFVARTITDLQAKQTIVSPSQTQALSVLYYKTTKNLALK